MHLKKEKLFNRKVTRYYNILTSFPPSKPDLNIRFNESVTSKKHLNTDKISHEGVAITFLTSIPI
jgi:hypothetical protein